MAMAAAAAGAAVLFAAVAVFFFLEQPLGRGPAALLVACVLGLGALALWRGQAAQPARAAPPAAKSVKPGPQTSGGPAPGPVESLGPAEAVALARWVVQERPLMALGVCLGVGYVLVRHPKAVSGAVGALASLAASRLAPK